MDRQQARDAVAGARVARLATRTRTGRMDLVPITFAFDGDRLVTAVDHKPKTTTHLKRLDNIRANPEISVLVDHYDDADWSQLWWVRLRGLATILDPVPGGDPIPDDPIPDDPIPDEPPPGEARRRSAVRALVAKYEQYRQRPPAAGVIVIDVVRWQWWSAGATPD